MESPRERIRFAVRIADEGAAGNHSGNTEAWIATIPKPATLAMLLAGGLALSARSRQALLRRGRSG